MLLKTQKNETKCKLATIQLHSVVFQVSALLVYSWWMAVTFRSIIPRNSCTGVVVILAILLSESKNAEERVRNQLHQSLNALSRPSNNYLSHFITHLFPPIQITTSTMTGAYFFFDLQLFFFDAPSCLAFFRRWYAASSSLIYFVITSCQSLLLLSSDSRTSLLCL